MTVKLGPMRLGYEGTIEIADVRRRRAHGDALGDGPREPRQRHRPRDDLDARLAGRRGLGRRGDDATWSSPAAPRRWDAAIVEDVATKLVDEMAACLAARISSAAETPAPAEPPGSEAGVLTAPPRPPRRPRPVSALGLLGHVLRVRLGGLLRAGRRGG